MPPESMLNKNLGCLVIPGLEGQTWVNPRSLLEAQASRITSSGFSGGPCLKQQGGDQWRPWPPHICAYTFHFFPQGFEMWAHVRVLLPGAFTRCLWHGAGSLFSCMSYCELIRCLKVEPQKVQLRVNGRDHSVQGFPDVILGIAV